MIEFSLNGEQVQFDGDESMPLLWYLREQQQLVGTKFACGIGVCGACAVHVDGSTARSCVLPMAALADRAVTTIEGLAEKDRLHPVQQAWITHNVPQCGYCQTGQIMAVADFLSAYPRPTDEQIDRNLNNLCRCGTYTRMRKAIHHAAALMEEAGDSV